MIRSKRRVVARSFPATDRDEHVFERLRSDGRVQIPVLAERLGVSEMTIRRDLDRLAGEGQLRRVRGGAVALGPEPFAQRYARQAAAKDIIARKLLELVGDGGAVALDASTTIQRLAHLLTDVTNLTALTNGPDTFFALQAQSGVTAILTGGQFDERTGGLVGPVAIRSTNDLVLRHAFISSTAVDPVIGTTEQTLEDSETKTALANASSKITLAVDHSKLGQHSAARGLSFDRIDQLVTDLDPDDSRLDPYRNLCPIL